MLSRFPVIVGPTAGGKTTLAVDLALRLAALGHAPSEVVTMDSMQVYRGMDVGTATPTPEERRGVPHHLNNLVEPDDRDGPFTADRWLRAAQACIDDLRARGGVPVVAGGTLLYAQALLYGLFNGPEPDPAIRAELAALDDAARRAELLRVDPDAAARIHPNDARRTIRALEVHRLTGRPISAWQAQWAADALPRSDVLLVGLDWPAEALNRRINDRVREMFASGLLEEVRRLRDAGRLDAARARQAREALGYKQVLAHLEEGVPLADAVEQVKIQTRRFAKQQRTWLRRLRRVPGALWIDAAELPPERWTETIVDRLAAPA